MFWYFVVLGSASLASWATGVYCASNGNFTGTLQGAILKAVMMCAMASLAVQRTFRSVRHAVSGTEGDSAQLKPLHGGATLRKPKRAYKRAYVPADVSDHRKSDESDEGGEVKIKESDDDPPSEASSSA